MARSYEAVVVGGGPGGYVAAIRLGQHGVKAAVIEREHMGGVCLNWGCVPSKALIHVAHTVQHLAEGEEIGITAEKVHVDVDKTRAWKDGIVAKLTGGVSQLVKGNKVDIIEGEATFTGPRTLTVGGEEIRFEKCIIAAGARVIEIPGFDLADDDVWTAREAVDLPEIPKRLVVIGGGVIGLELGTVYAKLGSEVTVVELTDGLLPGTDRDLVRVVERRLKKLGVRVMLSTAAKGLVREKKKLHVAVEAGGKTERIEASKVLVAVGFRPNSDRLGLSTLGVRTKKGGAIEVDARMETSVPGLFAIGDITGAPFLAHRAFRQGEVAADVIAGKPAAYDVLALPAAVFTDPEIATTGLTEDAAREAGYQVATGRFSFAANGRALGTADPQGFVKTVVDADTGTLLGVHIVGPGASELISEGSLGIEMGAVAEDIGLTVHPHPTLSEAFHEAVLGAVGEAIHAMNTPPKKKAHEAQR